MDKGKYGHLIVSELLHEPEMTVDFKEIYNKFAKRILWIDGNIVPGAFQMNTSWYKAVPEIDPIFAEHAHEAPEIIGFFGTDPENPYELNGEVQIDLEDEPHVITGSSLIFVPSNLPHTLHINRVDKPIFHFSVVMSGLYDGTSYR